MKKFRFFLIMLFLLVILIGCAEQKLLERVGLVTLLGYDLGSENLLSTTAVIRQVNPEFQSNIEIINAENETSKGTRTKINRKVSKKVVPGQLRVTLFGQELAEKGIGQNVDALSRDSVISGSLFMAVVEGQAEELLTYKYENIEDIGQHIFKMLEQNIESEQIISTTLHEVAHDYHSIGEDIAMPIIKREEELILISGVALLNQGKMVGKLPPDDSFYLKLVRDRFEAGTFEASLKSEDIDSSLMKDPPKELSVVLDTIKSKKNLKLVKQSTPEFDLHISMKARLLELNEEIDLGDPKNIAKLEKGISKFISKEISRIIAECQEMGSDVFGFGEKYRSSVRNSELTNEKWHELYKEAKVNVNIDFTILRTGTLD